MNSENEQGVTGEELYRRFLQGDNDAFHDLVALYEDELSRFVHNIVSDYHDAKHITIESFAQLALSGGRFAGKSSLKTYLFAIGKNMAKRHMRKYGRIQHIPYEDIVKISNGRQDEGETPQSLMESDENRRIIRKAMQELKDDHRIVLVLLHFEDMSYKQAGHAMKKTEKQIRNLAHRAKAALKKKLESEDL